MKSTLPTDCGNSPRITLVGELVRNWAGCEVDAVALRLADDAEWTFVGRARHSGAAMSAEACPARVPDQLVVTSIITHGRLASCDGYLETDGGRTDFSHVFRFASTSKTAAIKELRTYLIDTAD